MSFWTDKNKQDIETLVEAHRKLASRQNLAAEQAERFEEEFTELHAALLKVQTTGSLKALEDIQSRLEKLELWRGELHRMLVEPNPGTGRPKLTKTGRFLKGRF